MGISFRELSAAVRVVGQGTDMIVGMRRLRACLVVAALCLGQALAQDPWNGSELMQPAELAAQISAQNKAAVLVLFVGFPVLYRSAHIPDAVLAGPGSKPEGLEALTKALRDVPRTRFVAIYCGCCPFTKCPNVRPAFAALREMGFSHVKVVVMDTNFHTDWVAKGFPVERPAADSLR